MPAPSLTSYPLKGTVSPVNLIEAGITVAMPLLGALGLARVLLRRAEDSRIPVVTENGDNVGYFLDKLPACPDRIPDWMLEEHNAR